MAPPREAPCAGVVAKVRRPPFPANFLCLFSSHSCLIFFFFVLPFLSFLLFGFRGLLMTVMRRRRRRRNQR